MPVLVNTSVPCAGPVTGVVTTLRASPSGSLSLIKTLPEIVESSLPVNVSLPATGAGFVTVQLKVFETEARDGSVAVTVTE